MRLKDLLLQGEQSQCVLAAMLEVGVKSLCGAAAGTVLSEWSEGLALSSARHCLSLLSPELGKTARESAWDTEGCAGEPWEHLS